VHENKHCYRISQRKNSRRVITFIPLEFQPNENDVIALRRSYATHRNSHSYKRRVSWIASDSGETKAVVEYVGNCPEGTVSTAQKLSSAIDSPSMLTRAVNLEQLVVLRWCTRPSSNVDIYDI